MNKVTISGNVISSDTSIFTKLNVNLKIKRIIIKNNDGIFPLVCFNCFDNCDETVEEELNREKHIEVSGILKDYKYHDFNDSLRVVKILMVNSIKTAEKEIKYLCHDDLWENLIKKKMKMIDVINYEKICANN